MSFLKELFDACLKRLLASLVSASARVIFLMALLIDFGDHLRSLEMFYISFGSLLLIEPFCSSLFLNCVGLSAP